MGTVTQALKKMGNATPYANKKWVAWSDNKTVFNNPETHITCTGRAKKYP